jgi:hypothetical protein
MGNHYSNIVVYDVTQEQLFDRFSSLNRVGFLSPTINRFTAIYDRDVHADFNEKLFSLSQLSEFLNCAVMATYLCDGSQFGYKIYLKGQFVDEYITDKPLNTVVNKEDKAKKLSEIFECPHRLQEIMKILSKPISVLADNLIDYLNNYYEFGIEYLIDSDSFPLEQIRHEALAVIIGIKPCWVVGIDYNNIIYDDLEAHFRDYDMDADEAIAMLKKYS